MGDRFADVVAALERGEAQGRGTQGRAVLLKRRDFLERRPTLTDVEDQRERLELDVRVSVREARDVIAALEQRAARQGHSLSDEIRSALRQRVAEAAK